jgi:hypothetical protein
MARSPTRTVHTSDTPRVWPSRTRSAAPVAGAQTRAVPSSPAEASSSRPATRTAHAPGPGLAGKALRAFAAGSGLIPILVALQ